MAIPDEADFSLADLADIYRAMLMIDRVRERLHRKFGEDDAMTLQTRAMAAHLAELFDNFTTQDEKSAIDEKVRASVDPSTIGPI